MTIGSAVLTSSHVVNASDAAHCSWDGTCAANQPNPMAVSTIGKRVLRADHKAEFPRQPYCDIIQ
jgi:hypothetical protein